MKFTITTEHTYRWPVKVRMPDPEQAGQFSEFAFEAKFRALPRSESRELLASLGNIGSEGTLEGAEVDTIRKVLTGWNDDVVGPDGAPIPFGDGALTTALEFPWFRRGVLVAYGASLQDGGPAAGN